jgi:2-keto-4-pentenoate hydratase
MRRANVPPKKSSQPRESQQAMVGAYASPDFLPGSGGPMDPHDAVRYGGAGVSTVTLEALAEELRRAEQTRTPIEPLSTCHPEFGVDDAYAIQTLNVRARAARVVGHKIGLTSEPMQRMPGVDQPDCGVLCEDRVHPSGVALEVIDSRIADWRIGLVDTIADNASRGCAVLGDRRTAPADVALAGAHVDLRVDGEVVDAGCGAAVLGHPAKAVAWLATALAAQGVALRVGDVVLSGSITKAIELTDGTTVAADFGPLGVAEVRVR